MTNCRDSKTFRFALAVAMALSLLLTPLVDHSASHGSAISAATAFEADVAQHAPSRTEDRDHGHSHDRAGPAESPAGQSHEHNPADHTHDVPVPAPAPGYVFVAAGSSWRAAPPISHHLGPSFGIKRPPRS